MKTLMIKVATSLLVLFASLVAQSQGANSPPTIIHFSGTVSFSFFNDCTGENVIINEAFVGIETTTVTSSGLNHDDVQITVSGNGIGETTGIQYMTRETIHESQAGGAVDPYADTFTDNFRLVSQAAGSTVFSVTHHLTITATGKTSVDFTNVSTFCH